MPAPRGVNPSPPRADTHRLAWTGESRHHPGMLSPVGALVRRYDPDRFLTALLAPPDRRETLLTLYAFNHELARAREVASQPLLALIRLQWWREVVEGDAKPHEVATSLAHALAEGRLLRQDLLPLIEAREIEIEGEIPGLAAWKHWLLMGPGGLAVVAGRALGAEAPDVIEGLRLRGAAYGVAGLLRHRAALGRRHWAPWPADLLDAAGFTAEAAAEAPFDPALSGLFTNLADVGRGWLQQARRLPLPRLAMAAALPAVLARRDLGRLNMEEPRPRGLGDRAAILWAAATGGC